MPNVQLANKKKDSINIFFMSKEYLNFYNNLVKLTSNKYLYKDIVNDQDVFGDRLSIFLFHFAFILKEFKNKEKLSIFYKEYKSLDESLKSVLRNDYVVEKKYFLFGTDKFGRDVLSRILVGSRISISIGFISVVISLAIGLFFGLISGYYSGLVDKIIMWLINVTWSIPTLLLVIAITLALGKGFWQVFIAVGLTMWVEVARLVRGQVKTLKERKFIVAAKVMGFSDFRIIMFHILPNIISPIIVISAANFAASILIESGLSFLGLGAQPPMISWGLMIKDHYNYIILGEPFLAIIPGICIMLLVTSFMLLGNSLRDILDVKN